MEAKQLKLVAFGAGRKDGNTEVFIKEALMAAEAKGLAVEYIRLRDFDVEPCSACPMLRCPTMEDPKKCVHGTDDVAFLIDKFLDSDGVLIGGPVYSSTASSMLYAFRDRVFGPKMDASFMDFAGVPKWAEGRVKARAGALISVGGAISLNWVAMGIPSLYSTCFSAQTDVVDYMNVTSVAEPGAAVITGDYIARAHTLGENLADAILTGDHRWRGEVADDLCPSCHFNLMLVNPDDMTADCATCGCHAHMVIDGDKVRFEWREGEQGENRLQKCGKDFHGREIREVMSTIYMPNKHLIEDRMKKYKAYTACEIKSPNREARKAALLEQHQK